MCNLKIHKYIYFISILAISCNPFAPSLDDGNSDINSLFGDQTTVEGFFQNFKYSYSMKDTLLYGRLLDENFVFVYRDYEQGIDVSWSRSEEMRITYRLFRYAQSNEIIWNSYFYMDGDSINLNVVRNFNLSIIFNANDIYRVDGKVNLVLSRDNAENPWKIKNWRDESNY